jgi:hypothetical protein
MTPRLGKERAADLIERAWNLESIRDVSELPGRMS